MKKEIQNPWKTLSSKEIYDNPWIQVTEHEVLNPGGGNGIYGKVSFKNLAIGIIPLDEELYTWIVGQHRYTLNEHSWEIPMGGGPLEQDVLDSAKRELKEETGLVGDSWELVQKIHTSNSVTDEVGYVFLARELTEGQNNLEESEQDLEVRKVHFTEVLDMIDRHEITDALSVAGILKVSRMLKLS
jgi:8-oxo-dGTP pyrophosphatase MutT (NUDIX family)